LIIYADAPLAGSITDQLLKAIGRWNSQILHRDRAIKHAQFTQRHLLHVTGKASRTAKLENTTSLIAPKRANHE